MKHLYFKFILCLMIPLSISAQDVYYNPLLVNWNTPFQTPPFQDIKPVHFLPAFTFAIDEAKQEVDAIALSTLPPTFENTIAALDKAGANLNRISGVFFNLLEADASKELQETAKEIIPLITAYSNYVSLNENLFIKIKEVYDNQSQSNLSKEQSILLEKTYLNFKRSGAELKEEDKKKYEILTQELSALGLTFKENVLKATNSYFLHITKKSDLKGIPAQEQAIAAEKAKNKGETGWIFDLSAPSYSAFMKYADNRSLREQIYKAYNSRAFHSDNADNSNIVINIVNKRLELAKLLGYQTYADYVLETRMAEHKDSVWNFLHRLTEITKIAAENDLKELTAFAKTNHPLQAWDWSYYADKLKKQKFNLDDQLIKPYFELENVKKGIFELVGNLYGLQFSFDPNIPVYHKDVQAYQVKNENNQCIAVLYLDFYTRDTKRNGAWMTSFREQYINEKGENIIPLVSLVLNYNPPTPSQPTLLTYDEMKTFLHEFGHALHGMLSQVHYQSLSGTSVPRDFVELPSQIMENWASEKDFLSLFAKHYQNGDMIPDAYIDQLIKANRFHAGYTGLRQLNYGILDMTWHSITTTVNEPVEVIESKATSNTTLLPTVEECIFSTSFSHIFAGGYAAGYYGYKWAEVLDADAFSLFKQNGIFDKKTAASFKEHILSKGGSDKPMDLYITFRGQRPTEEAFLKRSGLLDIQDSSKTKPPKK